MAKRRASTDEVERGAVALTVASGHIVKQVVKELGIGESLLQNWRGQSKDLQRFGALEVPETKRWLY